MYILFKIVIFEFLKHSYLISHQCWNFCKNHLVCPNQQATGEGGNNIDCESLDLGDGLFMASLFLFFVAIIIICDSDGDNYFDDDYKYDNFGITMIVMIARAMIMMMMVLVMTNKHV